jgi:drug/metabolite transporter (DMT)-like permease
MVILGGETKENTNPLYDPSIWAYVALLSNPLAIAAGNLAMRKGKKLNDSVVSCYMALAMLVFFLPFCLVSGKDLTIIADFSALDWVCIWFIAAGTIVSQTLRFMALKNHTLTGVQPYTFLQPLQQFATDLLLFGYGFTLVQLLGVGCVGLVYSIGFYMLWRSK